MKHLKTYENIKKEPKVGDYIIVNYPIEKHSYYNEEILDFLNNNIGQLIKIKPGNIYEQKYLIYYDNVTESIKNPASCQLCIDGIWYARLSEILYYSNDKEYLEALKNANKYNI